MAPILGLLTKKGASVVPPKAVSHLPMSLHAFATRNAQTRRYAGTLHSSGIRYHKSRSMGRY